MTDESTTRSVTALVAVLVTVGSVVSIGAGVLFVSGSDVFDYRVLAVGVALVAATQGGWTLRRFRGTRAESISHDEVLYPFLLVFAGPAGAVVAFAFGSLLANAIESRPPIKAAFNVSQFAVAAGTGGSVALLFGGPTLEPMGVAAVAAGTVGFVFTESAVFAALMARLLETNWWAAIRDEMATHWPMYLAESLLGITAALAIKAVPALAPVAFLTVVVVLEVQRRWFAIVRDREQLADLMSATTDIHASITVEEVERSLIEAVHTMTSASARIIDAPTHNSGGLGVSLDTGTGGVRWLYVHRSTPLEPTAVAIVETLARVAEVSYRTASLLEDREQQAVQLREIIEEREAFLSATAHQLRTPLTAMVGFASLLWDEPEDPRVIREMMSHIVGQAGQMTHHLDNLLISSRSITDSVHIALEPVDLRAEADRVASALAPGARTEVEGDGVTAVADAVRVRHILRNLVLNAELHGGEYVRLVLGSTDDRVWAEVIDDGPGVAVDEEELIFESLKTARSAAKAAGLGLHVGRLLARMMDGEVTYSRRDRLTVFRLELPAVKAPASHL